ncbi:MAG TPA: helix-turn-helix domain-containing protein [Pseudonocardiaceae bacterium]|nr:helix-turn-helix domain-containing protein [Pseudonocardiaceae bacterium]
MSPDDDTPMRADARRNRDQIIGAAKVIFASEGPDAPMEEIARRAGVGVGTLYRRFPDRDALIRGVARDNLASTLAHAKAAAAEESTGWAALERLMRHSEEMALSVRLAMLSPSVWTTLKEDPVARRLRDELMTIIDEVVHTAQAEGSLRPDVGAGDVAALFSVLLRRLRDPDTEIRRMARDRALAIMLDGLRVRPDAASLPGHPLSPDEVYPAK